MTDIVPNKPEASVVTLVVPFLWIGDAGTGVAKGKAGSTAFTGEANIEFEALDSVKCAHAEPREHVSQPAHRGLRHKQPFACPQHRSSVSFPTRRHG